VINAKVDEASSEDRPWAWVAFGVLATLVLWLPLARLGVWVQNVLLGRLTSDATDVAVLTQRLSSAPPSTRTYVGVVVMASYAVPMVVAVFLSGLLMGRFGGKVGPREGALAGLVTALLAVVLASATGGFALGMLVPVVVMPGLGFAGAKVGVRLAKRN
jgi:hypothetical protein